MSDYARTFPMSHCRFPPTQETCLSIDIQTQSGNTPTRPVWWRKIVSTTSEHGVPAFHGIRFFTHVLPNPYPSAACPSNTKQNALLMQRRAAPNSARAGPGSGPRTATHRGVLNWQTDRPGPAQQVRNSKDTAGPQKSEATLQAEVGTRT